MRDADGADTFLPCDTQAGAVCAIYAKVISSHSEIQIETDGVCARVCGNDRAAWIDLIAVAAALARQVHAFRHG